MAYRSGLAFAGATVLALSVAGCGGSTASTNGVIPSQTPPATPASSTPAMTTAPVTSSTVPSSPSATPASATTNPATGHLPKKVGETLTIYPQDQATADGPGATKLVVTKISKGKPAYDGSKTVRVSMTASTGNDQEINEEASQYFCGVMRSVDPDSGEELSGRGGMMVSANPPTTLGKNKTYSCTFDAEGLHDHGWLVLGNGGSTYVDYSYDVR